MKIGCFLFDFALSLAGELPASSKNCVTFVVGFGARVWCCVQAVETVCWARKLSV